MNTPKAIAFRFFPLVSAILPLNLVIRITGRRTVFPFYHLVSDTNVPHIKNLYRPRNTKEFSHDLAFLLKHFQPISIDDLIRTVNTGQQSKKPQFLLSFDDGLREFHDIAAPILIKKGIPAVCFLNSAFVDNKDLFYRYKASLLIEKLKNAPSSVRESRNMKQWFQDHQLQQDPGFTSLLTITYQDKHLLDELAVILEFDFREFLDKQRPYLGSGQIESLISQGFAFGAHSIDHPEYRFLPIEEQLRQTKDSIRDLMNEFGLKHRIFSFPFTDFGVKNTFFDSVFNESNPLADLAFGGAGLKKDSIKRNIQRIPFEGTELTGQQILTTEYIYYIIKSIFGKNLIRR